MKLDITYYNENRMLEYNTLIQNINNNKKTNLTTCE